MQKTQKKAHKNVQSGVQALQLATEAHQKYLLRSCVDDLNCAINYYVETIKENPKISQTYYRLASLLHETGQIGLESAVEQCREAVNIDPKNPDAHMYLGYFLALAGDNDSATEQFKTAIKLKPLSSARARIIMAMTLLENNQADGNKFKNLVQMLYCLFSGSALFLLNKASFKMMYQNVLDDISYIKYRTFGGIMEKFKNDKKAYETYTDALDKTKNQTVFYKKMAKIAIRKGNFEVARQCWQNALMVSNNDVDCLIDVIEFTEEHFPANYDELIEYYNYLIKINPNFSRCYYEVGHLYIKKDEPINAVNAFKMALEQEEDNPFYLNSLAFAYVQLEQYDDAIELYKKALELNPDSEWSAIVAQALAAIYYQIKGNYDAAMSMLQNALLLTKDRAQIYQTIADINYEQGDLDEAINYYQLALKKDSTDSRSYSRLAMAYWEADQVEQSILNYTKAVELDPEYDIAYNNLGVVFLDGLGRADCAITNFERAIEINPNYVLAYFNKGRAHEALSEKIEAANNYQTAIDLNKTSKEVSPELIEERLFRLFDI